MFQSTANTSSRQWILWLVMGVAVMLSVTCGGSETAVTPTASESGYVETGVNEISDPLPTATPRSNTPSISSKPESTAVTDLQKPGVLPSSIGPDDSRLQVKLQGADEGRLPLHNGGTIRLGDNLMAEIFVDPYPTNALTAWVDLYLQDNAGMPVTDARVVIDYDMYSMAHGPFFSLADKKLDGHYIFRLDYIMFGPWGQLLQVRPKGSDEEHKLEVTIVASP